MSERQTPEEARAEVYNELVGHLQIVIESFTEEERREAEKMMRRWLPKTGWTTGEDRKNKP